MEFIYPVACIGYKEIAHFVAPKVEYVRSPVGVFAAKRIGVFIQRCAVETSQREIILGEVGGYPIHNDANILLMEAVNKVFKVIRASMPGIRGIVPGDLIPP